LTLLVEVGIVHRLQGSGSDMFARYELAEELAGHHHHVTCGSCGTVADVSASPRLERALAEAARIAADQTGFEVTGHHIELLGRRGANATAWRHLGPPGRRKGRRWSGRRAHRR